MNQHEWDQVNIRWTDHDVPHIEAQNYASLGFGYGYVHARDRLCELSGQVITLRGSAQNIMVQSVSPPSVFSKPPT